MFAVLNVTGYSTARQDLPLIHNDHGLLMTISNVQIRMECVFISSIFARIYSE